MNIQNNVISTAKEVYVNSEFSIEPLFLYVGKKVVDIGSATEQKIEKDKLKNSHNNVEWILAYIITILVFADLYCLKEMMPMHLKFCFYKMLKIINDAVSFTANLLSILGFYNISVVTALHI